MYILNIFSPKYKYKKIFIEIKGNKISSFYYNDNNIKNNLNYPLKLPSGKPIIYFQIKKNFEMKLLLKSPMGIIFWITILLLLCLNCLPNIEELKKADYPGRYNNDN